MLKEVQAEQRHSLKNPPFSCTSNQKGKEKRIGKITNIIKDKEND